MKLSLVVLTPGKQQGQTLDIKLSQFLVGRDPQCHLRPASPLISKRHCALIQRDGKVFIRDFDSTNGTVVNDQPLQGETELHHEDRLKIGPLLFGVRIEDSVPVSRPTPPPPTKAVSRPTPPPPTKAAASPAAPTSPAGAPAPAAPAKAPPASPTPAPATAAASENEEDIAAMLLALQDDGPPNPAGGAPDPAGQVPEGSTVMDLKLPSDFDKQQAQDAKAKEKEREKAKVASGNTQSAAKSILEKMMRRPRQ